MEVGRNCHGGLVEIHLLRISLLCFDINISQYVSFHEEKFPVSIDKLKICCREVIMVSPAAISCLLEILSSPADFPDFALKISRLNSALDIFVRLILQILV